MGEPCPAPSELLCCCWHETAATTAASKIPIAMAFFFDDMERFVSGLKNVIWLVAVAVASFEKKPGGFILPGFLLRDQAWGLAFLQVNPLVPRFSENPQ